MNYQIPSVVMRQSLKIFKKLWGEGFINYFMILLIYWCMWRIWISNKILVWHREGVNMATPQQTALNDLRDNKRCFSWRKLMARVYLSWIMITIIVSTCFSAQFVWKYYDNDAIDMPFRLCCNSEAYVSESLWKTLFTD